jgi:hypothetical protein
MPVIQSLMDKLVKQYGPERGRQVYYSMEAEGSGPFAKGAKYRHLHEEFAARHGVEPAEGGKKPSAPKGSRAPIKGGRRPAGRPAGAKRGRRTTARRGR